MNKLNTYMEMS